MLLLQSVKNIISYYVDEALEQCVSKYVFHIGLLSKPYSLSVSFMFLTRLVYFGRKKKQSLVLKTIGEQTISLLRPTVLDIWLLVEEFPLQLDVRH